MASKAILNFYTAATNPILNLDRFYLLLRICKHKTSENDQFCYESGTSQFNDGSYDFTALFVQARF